MCAMGAELRASGLVASALTLNHLPACCLSPETGSHVGQAGFELLIFLSLLNLVLRRLFPPLLR